MAPSQDQQPTHLLWVAAVIFCEQKYKLAREQILLGTVLVSGQVVRNPLLLLRSGDALTWQQDSRAVDLDVLRKANILRRQTEAFLGGPEVAYRHLGAATMPSTPPE